MTSSLLKEALEMLKARGDHDKQKTEQINQAIHEIVELQQLYTDNDARDTWHDEISVITISNVCDIVIEKLYDMYGELYRANDNKAISSEQFIIAARTQWMFSFGLEHFTDYMLDAGWQVINDLYSDNETEHNNDALGHYASYHDETEATALQKLLQAANETLSKANDAMEKSNDAPFASFQINVGSKSIDLLLGGVQMQALCTFIQSIADENGYDVNFTDCTVTE